MLNSKLFSGFSSMVLTTGLLLCTVTTSTAWAGERSVTWTNSNGDSVTKTRYRGDDGFSRSRTRTNAEGNSVTRTRSRGDDGFSRSESRTDAEGNSMTRTRSWSRDN
ncbi:hypothetical protein PCC8801_2784 [Rippkaea orientalis PCC 8801]|uniref:Uncharacterized protein n=1 Tax=Rippkaea orientalis (strain PCC 8801 / RF-1) TaxID=41431 RepID=B7K5Q2_RIPO1|nr:hypothetical protein [Rippkaea orientalis]ACK66785.1 hypothetical protein PCC8801_2784 [Rippkaea orientalis PCC 8801]